jgi:catechol 2,3-dioxygenase-like lactoylglutathione lyase family enzyme
MLPVTTNLIVSNMAQSLSFYCGLLGFEIEFGVLPDNSSHFDGALRDYQFVALHKNDWKLMLQTIESFAEDLPDVDLQKPLGGSFTLFFRNAEPDALYQSLKGKVKVLKAPATAWYGMREVYFADPDGYMLCFATEDPNAAPPA